VLRTSCWATSSCCTWSGAGETWGPIWSCARDLPLPRTVHPRPRAPHLADLLLVRFIGTRTGRTRAAVREDLTGSAGTFIPDQRTHHRHPRGAGRARSPRRGRSCAWIPPPHGARRSRHLLVPSSGNSPKSQVSLLRSKSQETGAGRACHLVLWVASATRVSGEHPARPLILVWPGGRVNH